MNFVPGIIVPAHVQDGLCFAFKGDMMLIKSDAKASFSFVPILKQLESFVVIPQSKLYMGTVDETPCFCMDLPENTPEVQGMTYIGLRQIFGLAGEDLFRLAGTAIQIINWDKNNQFCGRCGKPTENMEHERAKLYKNCGLLYFPKISPE